MPIAPSAFAPFRSAVEVVERVADRSLGLLSLDAVAVDRLLMSLHPESARLERETLAYLERLHIGHGPHAEPFETLCGVAPGTFSPRV